MRKLVLIAGVMTILAMFCGQSYSEDQVIKTESRTVKIPNPYFSWLIENLISTDCQYISQNYSENYKFYASRILLKNYLDELNDGEVTDVANVFQVITNRGDNNKYVVITEHTTETQTIHVTDNKAIEGFEDYCDVANNEFIWTFRQAYDKFTKSNLPKPHSKQVTLCKIAKFKNPQYIFGDAENKIYIDAITGDVSAINPAFDQTIKLGAPLGEWP